VPPEFFLACVDAAIERVERAFAHRTAAIALLREQSGGTSAGGGSGGSGDDVAASAGDAWPTSPSAIALRMLEVGHPPSEAFVAAQLVKQRDFLSHALLRRQKIPVPDSGTFFGGCDPTGSLAPGTVYVVCGGAPLRGGVVVARAPCLHAGEIRCLEAVTTPALERWRAQLGAERCGCVCLFATRGDRAEADTMGGDYDGDRFFVAWNAQLVAFVRAVADVEPPPPKLQPHVRSFGEHFAVTTGALFVDAVARTGDVDADAGAAAADVSQPVTPPRSTPPTPPAPSAAGSIPDQDAMRRACVEETMPEGGGAYSTGQLYDMWLRVADAEKPDVVGRRGSGSAGGGVEEPAAESEAHSVAPPTQRKAARGAGRGAGRGEERGAGRESSLLRELRVAYIASLDHAKHGVRCALSKKARERARAHSKPLHMIDAKRPGKEPASTRRSVLTELHDYAREACGARLAPLGASSATAGERAFDVDLHGPQFEAAIKHYGQEMNVFYERFTGAVKRAAALSRGGASGGASGGADPELQSRYDQQDEIRRRFRAEWRAVAGAPREAEQRAAALYFVAYSSGRSIACPWIVCGDVLNAMKTQSRARAQALARGSPGGSGPGP
jgi:hypothetical protein